MKALLLFITLALSSQVFASAELGESLESECINTKHIARDSSMEVKKSEESKNEKSSKSIQA